MNIDELKKYLQRAFSNIDKAHDYQHSLRVYLNALQILNDYNSANKEIVALSALLHDVVDKKLFSDDSLLNEWFEKNPSIYEKEVRQVISEVSFSQHKRPSSLESKIVQDADRLDAIGAIGIARVFTYGGAIGRSIYSETELSSVDHFDEKLFKIAALMNTTKGYQLAIERHIYMESFIKELKVELGLYDNRISRS